MLLSTNRLLVPGTNMTCQYTTVSSSDSRLLVPGTNMTCQYTTVSSSQIPGYWYQVRIDDLSIYNRQFLSALKQCRSKAPRCYIGSLRHYAVRMGHDTGTAY
jgi:hypothetical protein